MINPHDQAPCPKCHRLYCEGYWGEGVCTADMFFSGEPTSDGDAAAEYLRVWYEAHRETWWERNPMSLSGRLRSAGCADNFILGLIAEVGRIASEQKRQKKT